jgi:hypothetical protein
MIVLRYSQETVQASTDLAGKIYQAVREDSTAVIGEKL